MPTQDEAKADAIAAAEEGIKALNKLIDELRKIEKGVSASAPDLLQVTRRLADAAAELFDQRSLVAHLRAQNVRVQPMSEGAREMLRRLLSRLDDFVRRDQEFHDRLELAQVIIGLANDHEKEIQELTT